MWKIKKNDDGSYEILDEDGVTAGCYDSADTLAAYLAFTMKKLRDVEAAHHAAINQPSVVQWIKPDGTPLEREADA